MYEKSFTHLLSKKTELELITNEKYLKSLQRPLDIERALEFPADFAILWKKTKCNKLYFHAPKQIGFCCSGGGAIGLGKMPKYKIVYDKCPLCEINSSVYHTHGKVDANKTTVATIITLIRGGYEYKEADKLATQIEKDMLHRCLIDVCSEDVVKNLLDIINQSKKYPCATIYKLITDLHEQRKKELFEKYRKVKKDYKTIMEYKISYIMNELMVEIINLDRKDRSTRVPKFYIYDFIYKWYDSLDKSYINKYIWDISDKWQIYSDKFYTDITIPQIPESHYMLYKSPKKIRLSSEYPNHKGSSYLSEIAKYQKIHEEYIFHKKRVAFILNKYLSEYINRNIFTYLANYEFLL